MMSPPLSHNSKTHTGFPVKSVAHPFVETLLVLEQLCYSAVSLSPTLHPLQLHSRNRVPTGGNNERRYNNYVLHKYDLWPHFVKVVGLGIDFRACAK